MYRKELCVKLIIDLES